MNVKELKAFVSQLQTEVADLQAEAEGAYDAGFASGMEAGRREADYLAQSQGVPYAIGRNVEIDQSRGIVRVRGGSIITQNMHGEVEIEIQGLNNGSIGAYQVNPHYNYYTSSNNTKTFRGLLSGGP